MHLNLTTSDGTSVSFKQFRESVEGLPYEEAHPLVSEWLEKEGVCIVEIAPEKDADLVPVKQAGWAKSAMAAATDVLRHGRYDLRIQGLHIYAHKDINAPFAENVAVMTNLFEGDEGLKSYKELVGNADPGAVLLSKTILGWTTARISGNEDRRQMTILKHSFIEVLAQGFGLGVWMAPVRDYIATFLLQLWEKDDAKSLEIRNSRIRAAQITRTKVQPVVHNTAVAYKKAVANGSEPQVDTTPIKMSVFGSSRTVDVMTLEPGKYMVYDGKRYFNRYTWRPDNTISVNQWRKLAELGLTVQIS